MNFLVGHRFPLITFINVDILLLDLLSFTSLKVLFSLAMCHSLSVLLIYLMEPFVKFLAILLSIVKVRLRSNFVSKMGPRVFDTVS